MNNKSLGDAGENFVVAFLQKQGFCIKAQNYRKFFGEVDIIAYKKELYIFVEVKTRRSSAVIAMSELISFSKQQKIIKTAETFIAEQKLRDNVYRFDVALVQPDTTSLGSTSQCATFSIDYIENAFIKNEHRYEY